MPAERADTIAKNNDKDVAGRARLTTTGSCHTTRPRSKQKKPAAPPKPPVNKAAMERVVKVASGSRSILKPQIWTKDRNPEHRLSTHRIDVRATCFLCWVAGPDRCVTPDNAFQFIGRQKACLIVRHDCSPYALSARPALESSIHSVSEELKESENLNFNENGSRASA